MNIFPKVMFQLLIPGSLMIPWPRDRMLKLFGG
jgi:hypothetical protein